ncbi:TetR/AcrR family transcriptional regulator [Tabrizicola sp.]|uniref:TetR/AcrR family transcriptional regulator n=1 Tax=Tabrizicola sp. TaxID=2005166 RepID=UPI003F3AD94B
MASLIFGPTLHPGPERLKEGQAAHREGPRLKTSYHHGELRQALIDAARLLIKEREGNDFSLSDACRRAGVSTAAPYRHFSDKTQIINEVVAQGFVDMTNRFRTAAGAFEPGSRDRILAVGQVYLAFAMAEPALFRMMFSQKPNLSADDIATTHGKACFAYVLQEVFDYCAFHAVEGDAQMIALQLWTLVHGASSLTIDGDYAKVAPHIDVRGMIASGAERLLFLLPQGRTK